MSPSFSRHDKAESNIEAGIFTVINSNLYKVKIERLSELKKTQFALLVQQETTYSG